MKNQISAEFNRAYARLVERRLQKLPFNIIEPSAQQAPYPTLRVIPGCREKIIILPREDTFYQLVDYEKREVPDRKVYCSFDLGEGFTLAYVPSFRPGRLLVKKVSAVPARVLLRTELPGIKTPNMHRFILKISPDAIFEFTDLHLL